MNRKERRKAESLKRKRMQKTIQNLRLSIPIEQLGPPGIMSELHLVAVPDQKIDGSIAFRDTSKREFQIQALLCKSKSPGAAFDYDMNFEKGSSFLSFPKASTGHSVMRIETTRGVIECRANSHEELAGFEFLCSANGRLEAISAFNEAIAIVLDHIAYVADLPIQIDKISCLDKKHNATSIIYNAPYRNLFFGSNVREPYPELTAVYALYREAKNSNSDYYKFLCYFKILEGIFKSVRPSSRKKAAQTGLKLPITKDVVPLNDELQKFHANMIGKSIKKVFDDEFEKDYRDAIAHFLVGNKAPLQVSKHSVSADFSNKIYLIESCCRVMIASEEKCLQIMRRTGRSSETPT